MNTAPNNSPLDIFIKDTLKAPGVNLTPVDWSEVEVLLRHEQKSIPVELNKKTITYSIAGAAALILVLIIFKIVQHYSSLPPEPETMPDAAQNTFSTVDTSSSSAQNPVPQADTVKVDSSAVAKNNLKIDSSVVVKSNRKRDSAIGAATLMPDSAWMKRIKEKQDKKRKQAGLKDTASPKTDTSAPIESSPVIIEPRPVLPEIEKENIPAPDTAKTQTAPQNNTKKKKNKSKKEPAPAATQQPVVTPPVETKPDSLKQQ